MTDPIVVRGSRKSVLRRRFREIQREHGAGTIVAFANGKSRVAQECLRGLMETGSITDPVYSREGFAVVKIVQDLDGGDVGPDTGADTSEAETESSQVTGDDAADTSTDEKTPPVPEDGGAQSDQDSTSPAETPKLASHPTPPPTSGPGSGVDAWRTYAATVTGTTYESWGLLSRAEIIANLEGKGAPVG